MGSDRTTPAQFKLIVSYMEQHGDINMHTTLADRLEGCRKWIELTDLLNNKALGESKPVEKWKKCWSDFKNNTKKKAIRIKKNDCKKELSPLEKRVLKLIKDKQGLKRKTSESDNEDTEFFKVESILVEEPCEMLDMPPSPASPAQSIREIQYELINHQHHQQHRKSSTSSSASETTNEDTPPPRKRNKSLKDITDVADKYLKFEREREKMAHEREMARIKQNDQLIAIFGKVVNVLEAVTPTIQKNSDEPS